VCTTIYTRRAYECRGPRCSVWGPSRKRCHLLSSMFTKKLTLSVELLTGIALLLKVALNKHHEVTQNTKIARFPMFHISNFSIKRRCYVVSLPLAKVLVTHVPRKYSFFFPYRRESAAIKGYISPVTTHIMPLPSPEKLRGSWIPNIIRLNDFPERRLQTMWQTQWLYPSPYANSNGPCSNTDFSPFTVI
jgi:hypothetical protein